MRRRRCLTFGRRFFIILQPAQRMSSRQQKFDWPGFAVHGGCGAVLGAAIGVYAYARSPWARSASAWPAVLIICGSALVCGVLAGVCQDTFWKGMGEAKIEWQWFMAKLLLAAAVIFLFVWGFLQGRK